MRWGYYTLALLGCSFSGRGQAVPDDAPPAPVGDAPLDGPSSSDDAPLDAPIDAPRPWWDPTYPYRMQITVTNAVALPVGYQLSVDLDLDVAPCVSATSQQGARIVQDHTTELPRFIEPSPATAGVERIWFKTTAALAANAGATSYWLYCGAPSPTAVQMMGDQVFDFFDGFDAALSSTTWNVRNGASVTAGELQLDSNESISSMATFGLAQTMEWSMRATATNGQYWGGLQSGATAYTAPWAVWISRQANTLRPEVLPSGTIEPSGNVIGTDHAITAIPIAYAIEYQQDHAYFRFQNGAEEDLTGTANPPLRVRFEATNANNAVFVDSVRVRKAVRPAPTTSLGQPEPY